MITTYNSKDNELCISLSREELKTIFSSISAYNEAMFKIGEDISNYSRWAEEGPEELPFQ